MPIDKKVKACAKFFGKKTVKNPFTFAGPLGFQRDVYEPEEAVLLRSESEHHGPSEAGIGLPIALGHKIYSFNSGISANFDYP